MTEVERVLELFTEINTIPRCSEKEERIAAWLREWATTRGFPVEQDETGNVLIRVPGTGSGAERPTVIVQGHMDMVCEKTPESTHDFSRDAVPVLIDDDWVHARDTTLGADNGIAIALALVAAETAGSRPPLEILITVDEESGLTGAQRLKEGWLTGTRLLNLDSEDEGIFTVGCAGGRNTFLKLPGDREQTPAGHVAQTVAVSGLTGGHSGVDIHLQRANANALLARLLDQLGVGRDGSSFRLASFEGGGAHNVIPRDARAVVILPRAEGERLAQKANAFEQVVKLEFGKTDPRLSVHVSDTDVPPDVMTNHAAARLIDLVSALPHGVVRMSSEVEGLVETSTNLASVRSGETVEIGTSQRSSSASRLEELGARVQATGRLAGASARISSEYPPWEPNFTSPLVERCISVYKEQFGTEPIVEVIHAGLECGVIGAKYPGLDMISFGPTIKGAHSPEERMQLSSLSRIWTFFAALLEHLAVQE